jgi:uncharacterized protein YndB with AHSA1/START domain
MIVESIEIARRPEEVFAYLEQLDRHVEWQENLVRVERQTEGPPRVGTRLVQVRRIPGGQREFTLEVTEHDAPRRLAARGLNGPVRPVASITVTPLADGSRSRLTQQLDLRGHGLLGKLIVPLARRDAAKQAPKNQTRLKELLESGA